ncbi:MAG: rhomboid family intramembrane serine protease [Candidatus Ranarchaeia archaeon]
MVVFERYNSRGKSWARNLIILSNVLMFLGEMVSYNLFIYYFSLIPIFVLQGRNLWSLITSMFLHGDMTHIFFNMWGIYIFGNEIEHYFGPWKFLILYLIWGVFANVFYILATLLLTPSLLFIPTLGASGALFGLMATYAFLYPNKELYVFAFIFPIRMKAKTFVLFYAILETIYLMLTSSAAFGGIAHAAHVGGFIAGLITIILEKRRTRPRSRSHFEFKWEGDEGGFQWDDST